MKHEPSDPIVIQPSLLEEPAATLAVRLLVQRGEPFSTVSYTITRPDDTWLACLVKSSSGGPEALRAEMARMTGEGLRHLFTLIGPF